MAIQLLPKTVSAYPLEEGKVFYISMQKICAAVFGCQSANDATYVYNLSKWGRSYGKLEL